MKKKFNDFTSAAINIDAGELLVQEIATEQFFLANEKEYDSFELEDEMECEAFDTVEINDKILYSRHTPSQYKTFKRHEIQAVFSTDLPNELRD